MLAAKEQDRSAPPAVHDAIGLPPMGALNAVAVYPVIGEPPREIGAPQLTVTLEARSRAVTPTGEDEIDSCCGGRQEPPGVTLQSSEERLRLASSTKSPVGAMNVDWPVHRSMVLAGEVGCGLGRRSEVHAQLLAGARV